MSWPYKCTIALPIFAFGTEIILRFVLGDQKKRGEGFQEVDNLTFTDNTTEDPDVFPISFFFCRDITRAVDQR